MTTLQPGDVLLSLGDRDFSTEIKRITGGCYSHATLWTGHSVIEATLPKVRELLPEKLVEKSQYLDAFRHRDATGQNDAIVVNSRSYLDRDYSTVDLVVAIAIGTFTAWTKSAIPWAAWNIQYQAGRVESVIGRLRALRRAHAERGVTCVELVVRAHLEAGLRIQVTLDPGGVVDFAKLWGALGGLLEHDAEAGGLHESAQEPDDARRSLRDELSWLEGIQRRIRQANQFEANVAFLKLIELEVGPEWDPEFVTPHQLANSPSFECLGTVPKERLSRPPVAVAPLDPERRR